MRVIRLLQPDGGGDGNLEGIETAEEVSWSLGTAVAVGSADRGGCRPDPRLGRGEAPRTLLRREDVIGPTCQRPASAPSSPSHGASWPSILPPPGNLPIR